MRRSAWLESYDWGFVTGQNAVLCHAKNAVHKPTSDGHDETRDLWESRRLEVMDLLDAVDLCRQCHRRAPFCFYNGNTFAAIIRDVIASLDLSPTEAFVVRSIASHIVAGVGSEEEERAFAEFCESME